MKYIVMTVFVFVAAALAAFVFFAMSPRTPYEIFGRSTEGLAYAKESALVDLHDGETYQMTIAPVKKELMGKDVRMLAYNGSIPGPILKVKQGTTITLSVENNSGTDQLVHSHGLRLENRFDGTHLVQSPIANGDNFSYTLSFPDPGLYWYHPHLREDYSQEMGLYGAFLVIPENSSYWGKADDERVMVLDDILLDDAGIAPFYKEFTNYALTGRFGNQFFINGQQEYVERVQHGQRIRYYLVNVANTRTFRISIPGMQLRLVGADASAYTQEQFVDFVDLAPSERAVIEVAYQRAGVFEFIHSTPQQSFSLAKILVADNEITLTDGADTDLRTNTFLQEEMAEYLRDWETMPRKSIRLALNMSGAMGEGMMMGGGHGMPAMMGLSAESEDGIEWEDLMDDSNKKTTSETVLWTITDESTGRVNEDIQWEFTKGELLRLRIRNPRHSMHPMQHPIHLHGQRFLVVETNGERTASLAWKDTVNVPAGSVMELLVEMSNPGVWMLHCHISEHLSAGMMMSFVVNESEI